MDEMLEAIQPEFNLDTEDPPTTEVEAFFQLLKASDQNRTLASTAFIIKYTGSEGVFVHSFKPAGEFSFLFNLQITRERSCCFV